MIFKVAHDGVKESNAENNDNPKNGTCDQNIFYTLPSENCCQIEECKINDVHYEFPLK